MQLKACLTRPRILAAVLAIEALLGIGFGVASLAAPRETLGTIVDLGNAVNDGLILAALASLSGFYILTGLLSAVAATLPSPHKERFILPLLLSHAWTGWKGFNEIGSVWLIGNPWPDIVIHASFVTAYSALLVLQWTAARMGKTVSVSN